MRVRFPLPAPKRQRDNNHWGCPCGVISFLCCLIIGFYKWKKDVFACVNLRRRFRKFKVFGFSVFLWKDLKNAPAGALGKGLGTGFGTVAGFFRVETMVKKMAMKRREARELAFTILYEMTFYSEKDACALFESEMELRPFEDDPYLRTVVLGVKEHLGQIDGLIEKYSSGWKVKRISRVSLAILRLCIFEMLYVEDIPYSVSINEAVELCKKYNDEKAPAFVNGILNAVADKEGIKA